MPEEKKVKNKHYMAVMPCKLSFNDSGVLRLNAGGTFSLTAAQARIADDPRNPYKGKYRLIHIDYEDEVETVLKVASENTSKEVEKPEEKPPDNTKANSTPDVDEVNYSQLVEEAKNVTTVISILESAAKVDKLTEDLVAKTTELYPASRRLKNALADLQASKQT